MTRRLGGEGGSTSVELAILVPVVLLVGLLVVAAGRLHAAQQAVDHAAATAARDASLARTPAAATAAARATAASVLDQRDLSCTTTRISVDTGGFGTRPGRLGLARVTVACTVTLGDLAVPGLPGNTSLSATFSSPVDPFRQQALGFRNPDKRSATMNGGDT